MVFDDWVDWKCFRGNGGIKGYRETSILGGNVSNKFFFAVLMQNGTSIWSRTQGIDQKFQSEEEFSRIYVEIFEYSENLQRFVKFVTPRKEFLTKN